MTEERSDEGIAPELMPPVVGMYQVKPRCRTTVRREAPVDTYTILVMAVTISTLVCESSWVGNIVHL